MKRKLIKRNKNKWSQVLTLPMLYRALVLNDRSDIKQKRRTKYKKVERFDLAWRLKRGTIMIPIFRSSYNSQSRIQNAPDGTRVISKIETFNEEYQVEFKLEDLPLKSFTGKSL